MATVRAFAMACRLMQPRATGHPGESGVEAKWFGDSRVEDRHGADVLLVFTEEVLHLVDLGPETGPPASDHDSHRNTGMRLKLKGRIEPHLNLPGGGLAQVASSLDRQSRADASGERGESEAAEHRESRRTSPCEGEQSSEGAATRPEGRDRLLGRALHDVDQLEVGEPPSPTQKGGAI